jgi:hypothetical protein
MYSIVHAEDRSDSLLNLGFNEPRFQMLDMNISPHEYEEIYSHNQKFVLKNLVSYSENALKLIGISEQNINLMGAALGFAFGDPRLNLNKSKTLTLELKDMTDSERASLYFGVNLDW